MKWGLWSTTAASNSATPPDGWPEGQAPSTVNDCAREMMAAIATGLQDIQFVDLGFAPTQTSGNTFTVSGTHADVIHYGRRLKLNDGVNTLYATVISATATSNTAVALRFDTGTSPLDSSLSSFAIGSPSQNNNAIPENVYRNKNFLDNSQFDVQQRGIGPFSLSIGVTQNKCTIDRWTMGFGIASAGPVITVSAAQRSASASDVPSLAQCGVLLNNSLRAMVTSAVGVISATDFLTFRQSVEGYDWRQLAQKPTTMSFWVRSDLTGTYCVSMRNLGNDQSIIKEYTISAASTWEKKIITFPPSPAAGTWDYSSGVGVRVDFCLASGSALNGGPGNWTAANVLSTVNQVNWAATKSSTFLLSAPKFEEGEQCTPISQNQYANELAKAQRYLNTINGQAFGFAVGNASSLVNMPHPTMREASISGSLVIALSALQIVQQGAAISVSSVSAFFPNKGSTLVAVNPVGTPLTTGLGVRVAASAGGTLLMFVIKSEL